MRPNPLSRRLSLLLTLALLGVALLLLARTVWNTSGELSHGYAAYYTSARLILDGADPVRFYDNRWFMEWTLELGFGDTPDIYNINPPTTALMLLPIAWLAPETADIVWNILNVALLAGALWLIVAALEAAGYPLRSRPTLLLALLAFAAIFNPVYMNFQYGQAYVLMLFLLCAALLAFVRGWDARLGGSLALMLTLKSAGTLLWLVLLLDRRWRSLGFGLGGVLLIVLLAAPLLGLRVWWEYALWLPSLFDQPWTGVTAYQTTSSLIHHLFKFDARFSPDPLVDLPWLASPLSMLMTLTLLGAAVAAGWLVARDLPIAQGRLLRFSMISALMIAVQPVGEEHSYAVLLPAVLIALVVAVDAAPGVRRGLMVSTAALGALLTAVPLPFLDSALVFGWRAFLAYPKLYGVLLVTTSLAVAQVAEPALWCVLARQRLTELRAALPLAKSSRRRVVGDAT